MSVIGKYPSSCDVANYKYGQSSWANVITNWNDGVDSAIISGIYTTTQGPFRSYMKIPDLSALYEKPLKGIKLIANRPDVPTGYNGKVRIGIYKSATIASHPFGIESDSNFEYISGTYAFGQNKHEKLEINIPITNGILEKLSNHYIIFTNIEDNWSYADYCVTSTYFPHLEIEYDNYTKISTPSNVSITNLLFSDSTATVNWTASTPGTGVAITKYNISYTISSSSGTYTTTVSTTTGSDVSKSFTFNSEAKKVIKQNATLKVKVQAISSVAGYDSDYSSEVTANFGSETVSHKSGATTNVLKGSTYYIKNSESNAAISVYIPEMQKIGGSNTNGYYIYDLTKGTRSQSAITNYNSWVSYTVAGTGSHSIKLQCYYNNNYIDVSKPITITVARAAAPSVTATFTPTLIKTGLTYDGYYTVNSSSTISISSTVWSYTINNGTSWDTFSPNSSGYFNFYNKIGKKTALTDYKIKVTVTDELNQSTTQESSQYHYPLSLDPVSSMTVKNSSTAAESQHIFSNQLYYTMTINSNVSSSEKAPYIAPYTLRAIYKIGTGSLDFITTDINGVKITSSTSGTVNKTIAINKNTQSSYYHFGIQIVDCYNSITEKWYGGNSPIDFTYLPVPTLGNVTFNISQAISTDLLISRYPFDGSSGLSTDSYEFVLPLQGITVDPNVFTTFELWDGSKKYGDFAIDHDAATVYLQQYAAESFFSINNVPTVTPGTSVTLSDPYIIFKNSIGATANEKIYYARTSTGSTKKRTITLDAISWPYFDSDDRIYIDRDSESTVYTPWAYNPGREIPFKWKKAIDNANVNPIVKYEIDIGLTQFDGTKDNEPEYIEIGQVNHDGESSEDIQAATIYLPLFLVEEPKRIRYIRLMATNNKGKVKSYEVSRFFDGTDPFILNRVHVPVIESVTGEEDESHDDMINLTIAMSNGDYGGNDGKTVSYIPFVYEGSSSEGLKLCYHVTGWNISEDEENHVNTDFYFTDSQINTSGGTGTNKELTISVGKKNHYRVQAYCIIGEYNSQIAKYDYGQSNFVTNTYGANTYYSQKIVPYEYVYYGIPPTVSYRKNRIGINKKLATTSETETVLEIQTFQSYNKVRLFDVTTNHIINIDLATGNATGFISEGALNIDDGAI